MSAIAHPQLQALVSEDCQDLLAYLLNEQVQGGEEVIQVVRRQPGLAALENVILQIARAYASCAFEQPTDLDIYTPRLQASLDEYPDLLTVVRVYHAHIDLRALNDGLSDESESYQVERLSDYLGQFLPERLA